MNDLIIVQNIEKRLREKRNPVIFPLTPTHRKELRDLKRTNVGNLLERLRIIKELKEDEYKTKYFNDIKKELKKHQKICQVLNDDWINRIKKMNELIKERKILEKKNKIEFLSLNHSYGSIATLEIINEVDRKFTFDEDKVTDEIAEKEFNEKFGDNFKKVNEKIDDITTKYEEAINFGDLEIVKELYYIMKSADSFFERISNLKV